MTQLLVNVTTSVDHPVLERNQRPLYLAAAAVKCGEDDRPSRRRCQFEDIGIWS